MAPAAAPAARTRIRSGVEQVFTVEKHRMRLFVRTIGTATARSNNGLTNIAYNLGRLVWLDAQAAPA